MTPQEISEIKLLLFKKGINSVHVSQMKKAYRGSPRSPRQLITVTNNGVLFHVSIDETRKMKKIYNVQKLIPQAAQIYKIIPYKRNRSLILINNAPGVLLWELKKSDRPSISKIRILGKQLLQSLRSSNIVHGDIRPWNIFWDKKSKTISLIDWGFSFFASEPKTDILKDHIHKRGHSNTPDLEIDTVDFNRMISALKTPQLTEKIYNHREKLYSWRPAAWSN